MAVSFIALDLDGTIVDSAPGIWRSADRALRDHDFAPLDAAQRIEFIGPPLTTAFADLGVPESMVDTLVTTYREHYADDGWSDFTVYDGIGDALDSLRSQGWTLGIATSKLTPFAELVMRRAGLDAHVTTIVGSERDGSRNTKSLVLAHALREMGAIDPAHAVLVGDRRHDVHGAHETGTAFVGVTWGYGTPEELATAGATRLVDAPHQLLEAIRRID